MKVNEQRELIIGVARNTHRRESTDATSDQREPAELRGGLE
jgi:hypothetical protein